MEKDFILGNGVRIPAVGFGTYKAEDGRQAVETVRTALEAGYSHLDCAAAYKNEKSIGEALRETDVARADLFVTSKLWATERSYDKAMRSFEKSLSDLGLDYLDLYLIHWPASPSRYDDWQEINLSTWRALERLYAEGLVRAIGVSNFMPHHLEPLIAQAEVAPMVNQIEYHPGFMQRDCVDFCKANGILVEAWSPLGRARVLENPLLVELAEKYGRSVAQICLRWELQNGVLPLPKSVNPKRIEENIHVWDFELTPDDMALISSMPPGGESGLDPDKVDF